MKRNYFAAVLALFAFISFNSCSGSSDSDSGGTETNNAAAGSGAAVAAVFGSMSGEASINEARIPRSILNLLIKKAIAQPTFTACDAVGDNMGPEGIDMALDGEDGDYGNPEDLFTVQDGGTYEFCTDGGDVAAWEITSAVSVDCTEGDESFTISMTGSGVFREDTEANKTVIGGDFNMTAGDDTAEAPCSFQINHDNGEFEGEGCAGEGLDPSDDVTCEDPGSDGGDNGGPDSGDNMDDDASTCETADDCTAVSGLEVECLENTCMYPCSADADCDVLLEDSVEEISCTSMGDNMGDNSPGTYCIPQFQ